MLKFLAMGTATASLIVIVAPPSHAQQRKTLQNQRQQTTVKPPAMKPYVRPVAPTVRDHRNAANPAVKPSERKRQKSSTCVKSLLGGPSVCGTVGKVIAGAHKPLVKIDGGQMFFREERIKNKKRSQTVDHRKKK